MANELHARGSGTMAKLDDLEGHGTRVEGARHGADRAEQIVGHTRGLGEWSVGLLLHDPEVGIERAQEADRIVDEPAVDPAVAFV
jgi:hypothetical protein